MNITVIKTFKIFISIQYFVNIYAFDVYYQIHLHRNKKKNCKHIYKCSIMSKDFHTPIQGIFDLFYLLNY